MTTDNELENKVSLEDIDIDQYRADTTGAPATSEGIHAIRVMGTNQHEISFKIDNSATDYTLTANTSTFADWDSFSGSPSTVLPRSTADNTCKVSENWGFFTGAAGMIGFSMIANDSTVYLRFAATDPYWSARSNRTMVELTTENKSIDQSNYNRIYNWGGSSEIDFASKKLKVIASS